MARAPAHSEKIVFSVPRFQQTLAKAIPAEQTFEEQFSKLVDCYESATEERKKEQLEFQMRQFLLGSDEQISSYMNLLPVWRMGRTYVVGEKTCTANTDASDRVMLSAKKTQEAKLVGFMGLEEVYKAGVLDAEGQFNKSDVTVCHRLNRAAQRKFQPK